MRPSVRAYPDPTSTVNGNACYQLVGIVYFGNSHFTARYVDPDRVIWFNDGMIQGRRAIREGGIDITDMPLDPNGKTPDAFIYKRCTG
ncbi:uncharacterized protein EV420DRAFT_551537 [Desarmillaria tabescens]|uniref:Uncharacterized protein n=1 Tax=Armillaria tabescens TaxID=1929756 RepID=A0AA39K6V0_ARMTA|nr:uncharacterized protein EV420DRAFT_551537 [Desarmillaria tabescens]KAK0455590.1 hypothetical protein EV420DRAFT_551537 [Desarmillaria tabescens]